MKKEMKERLAMKVKTTKEENDKEMQLHKEQDEKKHEERRKKLEEVKHKTAKIKKEEHQKSLKE